MIASSRFLPRLGVFGFMLAVGTSAPTDSTRHVHGYGGIVPLPTAVVGNIGDAQSLALLGRRLATRAEKGRVLYANERVTIPAGLDDTRTVSPASRQRRPCSQLVQSRTMAGAPTS
jgi:hypothetical protein